VYISHDRGISWAAMATVVGQYWSNLFVTGADVFLLGTTSDGITRGANAISLARSADSGVTWQRTVSCVHATGTHGDVRVCSSSSICSRLAVIEALWLLQQRMYIGCIHACMHEWPQSFR